MARWIYRATVALVFAFIAAPLLVIVWASFFSDRILTFPPAGYTLAWFGRAWQQPDFASGFATSVQVGVCAAVGALLLGVPAALAIERFAFAGRAVVRQLLLSPMYVPAIVAGAAVYVYFVKIEMLTGLQFAATFRGLVIAHTLVALPWVLRLVCASLAMAPAAAEEAARSLGANPLQAFLRVTLPSIRPGIVAAALFAFIASFSDLEKSLFLVGPGQTTLPIAIVNYLEWNLDSTIAAVATVQILVIGAALFISDRMVHLGRAF